MLFQALDNKNDCVGVYAGNELIFGDLPEGLSRTWSWAPYLPADVEYARIWADGAELGDICPVDLRDSWEAAEKKLKAFYRSFILSKINLDEHCFFDMVPNCFLEDYCKVKNMICQWVFENYSKPENHDNLVRVLEVLGKIKDYRINLDENALEKERYRKDVKEFAKKISKYQRNIDYSVFGSATGRLTTSRNSFPILRLDRKYRRFIKPNNDWFVEFDYNAADIRSLFYITERQQPQIDVHEWNVENIFKGKMSRDMAKRMIFSWLYDLEKQDKQLEEIYGRDYILKTCWDGDTVTNPFGRTLKADRKHAIPYLIQSTTADYVSAKMVEVSRLLDGLNTSLAFSIHDSIVVDMDWNERGVVGEILRCMRQDGFMVSASTGKDFGNLKRLAV